jgi:WbqC-like protein family
MKSIAILQSNYIPWQGYFDLIRSVDEFVILDSVQFTKNDWRNRNRIKTPTGLAWLTIPIRTAGRFPQRVVEAEVAENNWGQRHWWTILHNYARASAFRSYAGDLERTYERASQESRLSTINRMFLELACRWLGIRTKINSCEIYPDHPDRVERLIAICLAAGAGRYLSGPRAKNYLDPARFAKAGIEVHFLDYQGYAAPRLSVIDGVLNS